MARAVSIRRSLLRNLVIIIALLGGMILLATFATARRATSTLATSLIAQTLDLVEARLEGFFEPVTAELKLARRWGEAGLLDIEAPANINRMLAPVIREHPQVSSLLVANERGREHMLLYSGGRWRNRQTRRDLWGYRTTWLEWTDDPARPITYDKDMPDYDPRGRIWYYGAIETRHQLGYHLDASSVDEQIHWAGPICSARRRSRASRRQSRLIRATASRA